MFERFEILESALAQLMEERKYAAAKAVLATMNPGDIAAMFGHMKERAIVLLFRLLPKDVAAETFAEMAPEEQELLIGGFSDNELKELLDGLSDDDAADLAEEMPASVVKRLLKQADPEMRHAINQLLRYPENSAGSIMTTEYVTLRPDMTVGESILRIRRQGVDKETIYTCYVTEHRVLVGVVTVKELLLHPDDDALVKDIMSTNLLSVSTSTDREEASQMLSRFPTLNHSKNHFYFEMMRACCRIASGEWFIPKNWCPPTREEALAEKEAACREAEALYRKLLVLRGRLESAEYEALLLKFTNLRLVTAVWLSLTRVFISYVNCLEEGAAPERLEQELASLTALGEEGLRLTGDRFYCCQQDSNRTGAAVLFDYIGAFVREVRESFRLEKEARAALAGSFDAVVCGGALEGHKLRKEVNFSDTLVMNGSLCRIPGNRSGLKWSRINAHGWFSYELRVRPGVENRITVSLSSAGEALEVRITLGEAEYEFRQADSHRRDIVLTCTPTDGTLRIRFDKISGNTPCIHTVCVQ